MSRVDDLVGELAPKGVQFKLLGDVGEFIRGSGLQKSDLADQGAPAIHYGQLHTYYGAWAETTKSFTDPALAARLRRAKTGDLIITTTSEDDAGVAKATAWLGSGEVAVSGDAYIYRHALDPRYVAYFFQSRKFQDQKLRHITGAKVRRISGSALGKISIPVPPIEVQREIVRTLDLFRKLEAELEAELEERRQQYAYYRDSLLTLPGAEKIPLGELGEFIRGKRFTKADYDADGIGCIHYGEIYTHYGTSATEVISHLRQGLASGLRYAEPGDVVIVDVGEIVEDVGKAVAWLGKEPVAIHDHSYAFRHNLNPAYVSYVMQTTWFTKEKLKYVARTKVKTLLIDGFSRIAIPVPSAEEQGRIVDILDKFDALVNDLSIGLPAELSARRQQYEYYRDKLLTFDEAVA